MANKSGYEGPDRRADKDRRSGAERRESGRGIRSLFPFSLFLDRRSGSDRRSGDDRRQPGGGADTGDAPPKPTRLAMEPLRLKELAEKSGIPLKRLQQAAAGKVELSVEEHAALRKP